MSEQLELFGGCVKTETPTWIGQAGEPRERRDGQTSQTLAVDSSDSVREDQDHLASAVERAPVQATGLARPPATPHDYDFSEPDPRCEPRPDWTPPEWLRLPGVDP